MSSHTILLVQPTRKPEGRTYSDYESVNDCMEVIQSNIIKRHTQVNFRIHNQVYDILYIICACLLMEHRSRNFINYLGCLQNLRGAFETIESIFSTNYLRH